MICGDYTDAPDVAATWFIDPPYQIAGREYRHDSRAIDYTALGAWCHARRGQVIACENVGADWLPFVPLRPTHGRHHIPNQTIEAIWHRTE